MSPLLMRLVVLVLLLGMSLADIIDTVDRPKNEPTAASPSSLRDVIDIVEPRDTIKHKGWHHMRIMRLSKEVAFWKDKFVNGVNKFVGDHIAPKVQRFNSCFAVRTSDLMTLNHELGIRRNKSGTGVRGRGEYRRWTPSGVLRACFGRGWAAPSERNIARRLNGKKPPQRRNVAASSATAIADHYDACATHVQRLKQAVAYHYVKEEIRCLQAAAPCDVCVLKVTFDESEQLASIDDEAGIFSMMMVHVTIKQIFGDNHVKTHHIALPPAFVANTDAPTLLNAILTRLPAPLEWLCRMCRVLWIMPGSDSARSCLKVGRHFAFLANAGKRNVGGGVMRLSGTLSLHGRCLMHMLGVCAATLMTDLRVISPMFCGCCLLQKGGTRKMIKDTAHKCIQRGLEIVFDEPDAPRDNQPYLRSVLQQLDYADEPTNILLHDGVAPPEPTGARLRRRNAMDRLSKNLAHSTIEHGRITKYRHGCRLGCHASRQEAVDEINADIDEVQLNKGIGVPALNRLLMDNF